MWRKDGRLARKGHDLAAVGLLEDGARERPHQRDVERRNRVVEPRALGLRNEPEPGRAPERASQRPQLAEENAKERRLAAAVRAQDADALACAGLERDPLQHRRAAVAGGEVARLEERAHAQRTRPPERPRTIASAFARSMPRYVAPSDPEGPSVSP